MQLSINRTVLPATASLSAFTYKRHVEPRQSSGMLGPWLDPRGGRWNLSPDGDAIEVMLRTQEVVLAIECKTLFQWTRDSGFLFFVPSPFLGNVVRYDTGPVCSKSASSTVLALAPSLIPSAP